MTISAIDIRVATEADVSAVATLMAAEAEELSVYEPSVELNRDFDWNTLAQIQIRRPRSHLSLAVSSDGVIGSMQTLLVEATPNLSTYWRARRVLRALVRRPTGVERDLVRRPRHGRIEHVFVSPSHRRLQAALLLYRDALAWLREERADFVEGIVHEQNHVIKCLATRSGFEPVRVMMRRPV